MLEGGGSIVIQGDTRFKGTGHNAFLREGDRDYLVYHAYDTEQQACLRCVSHPFTGRRTVGRAPSSRRICEAKQNEVDRCGDAVRRRLHRGVRDGAGARSTCRSRYAPISRGP